MRAHALSAALGCAPNGTRLARRPARRAQPARCAASSEPRSGLSSSFAKVFVAGATGETGSAVVARLVAEGIAVRALVRNPDAAAARALPAAVERVQGDVSDVPALVAALRGCDAVVCATGVRPTLDPTGPYRVDFIGTVNLVAAGASPALWDISSYAALTPRALVSNARSIKEPSEALHARHFDRH